MSQIDDGQASKASSTTSVSVLPQRIEFHLSRKSSFSFSGSSFNPQNPSPSESSGALNSNVDSGIESDFKSHTVIRSIGAGLENLGNTCFLNSVLQCLTYTEPLVAYLQSGKHQNSCRVVGFCSLCAIQKHITRTLQATRKVLAPKEIVSNLRCLSRNFRNGRQEDAHEYMVHLLESMHNCGLPSGVPNESSSAYEKSFVHKIFGGCLRSQVKCTQCSSCSNKFDPFLDLSLEIARADSLQKALTHYTAQEQLDGGERRYQCQQCKKKVQALKQLTIDKAPYVLTIHLKRFGSHISGQKIDKKVQFGSSLNLKPFVSGSYDGELNYKLYGVLVHDGWSTHSGHYYCFVRASSGMWYSLDDSRVVQVSEKTVMQQKAYVLFYIRDVKTLAPKNIAGAIQRQNIVSNSTKNGACSISATNQRLENKSTDKPASAVLGKAISTTVGNGTGSTSATCQESQQKFDDKSVSSVKKEKTKNFLMQNGTGSTSATCPRPQESSADNPASSVEKDKLRTALTQSRSSVSTPEELAPEKNPALNGGNTFNRSSHQRLKNKILKHRVASTRLSLRMLMISSTKHKKLKRSRQLLAAESIVDEPIGLPTSHLTTADDAKSSNVMNNMISVAESCASELNTGVVSGDTMPTGDNEKSLKSPETPATSNHQQDGQPSNLKVKINVDTGISVAQWDDVELEPSRTSNAHKKNNKAVKIGYVPDEWDEEYDRGKRKKIRTSTIVFGGPNPFQEVATKAAKKSNARNKQRTTSLPIKPCEL